MIGVSEVFKGYTVKKMIGYGYAENLREKQVDVEKANKSKNAEHA